jgi:solute carrier family 30 (zinc transporter), member 5/7
MPGVLSVQSPHFWTLSSDNFVGGIKIEVSFNCDPRYVSNTVKSMFAQVSQLFTSIFFFEATKINNS